VPVPQAYPVSTNKSKIGSVLFICIIIGYLIFDFVRFIKDNVPTLNAYSLSTINIGPTPMPSIAFGLRYYDSENDFYSMITN
jgi:hypothetical protein